jgi:hydroxyethylthiazole kinase-like uncharacterized protein yjeF
MGTALLTVSELRAIEQSAQRVPAGELMARAGQGAAQWIDRHLSNRPASVCVVAGPGNNGGDGFVIASELKRRGHDVTSVLIGAVQPAPDDAREAHARWRAEGGIVLAELPERRFDVVVDALFGIGLARPLAGDFLAAVRWINASGGRVIAVDVPSGLDADRGHWVGNIEGVFADTTVTFIGDKPGLHTGAGADAAGTLHVEPLGLAASTSVLSLIDATDFAGVATPRRRDTHKGTYGNLLVVGGAAGMVGAPLLAARAALRLGAGRVYVDCIGAPELQLDPLQPELMFRRHASLSELDAIVVGCGLGADDAARAVLAWCWSRPAALVVDADALNLLASDASTRRGGPRSDTTVLTPHPLEAARLLGSAAQDVQADRVGAARRIAAERGAIVVLKGAGTVVARPDGRAAINPTGSPALATAGTGDVLAGMLGALLAQRYDAWEATLAAVWLHGAAVHEAGDIGIVAGEVATRAVEALRALRASH